VNKHILKVKKKKKYIGLGKEGWMEVMMSPENFILIIRVPRLAIRVNIHSKKIY
jgi:hypothetical protein